MILKDPIKYSENFLQKILSMIKKLNLNLFSLTKNSVTPTSQMPTSASKVDIPYTSINGSKPSSFEPSNGTPIIEKLQQENAQLLQQLEERKTMDMNLHHDNAVLQEKMNSIQ
jgi:hypothetical protein